MARPDTQTRLAIEMIRRRVVHADHAAYRLPGERGLAVELGLSRQTVRRAINQLVDEGLLQRGPTGRLGVRRGSPDDGADPRPLVAFLNPGGGSPETRLWREGVFDSLAGRDVVMRSLDRKSTRLNSSHVKISYAVFCLKKKITIRPQQHGGDDRPVRSR